MDSEKLIIELNFRNKIVDERLAPNAVSSRKMMELLPETVINKRTLEVIEIHDLFKAVDHTTTHVGSAKLFHSLMNPSESIELIHAKQDSFCELESNTKLRNAINEYLGAFHEGEKVLFKFLNGHMVPLMPYGDFRGAMKTIRTMLKAAENIPKPEQCILTLW